MLVSIRLKPKPDFHVQRRPFEVPAPQAANSVEELQMEMRHCNREFASAHNFPKFVKDGPCGGDELRKVGTRGSFMTFATRFAAMTLAATTFAALICWSVPASAQQQVPPPAYPQQQAPPPAYPQPQAAPPAELPPPQRQPDPNHYGPDELVGAGHKFFGNVSRGLASVIERAVSQWGLPNGYILGEEGSGAFVAGLRYGEGTLYTKNAGDLRVYWQGPSVGFDWGGDGARTMTLVYNLPATAAIYQRFAGIDGSAYIIGGFGMTALTANNIVLVPIRSGLGLRLGANIGYLKYTPRATWNPF
jgi:hypothetical protein